jgi:hypothetical protein
LLRVRSTWRRAARDPRPSSRRASEAACPATKQKQVKTNTNKTNKETSKKNTSQSHNEACSQIINPTETITTQQNSHIQVLLCLNLVERDYYKRSESGVVVVSGLVIGSYCFETLLERQSGHRVHAAVAAKVHNELPKMLRTAPAAQPAIAHLVMKR